MPPSPALAARDRRILAGALPAPRSSTSPLPKKWIPPSSGASCGLPASMAAPSANLSPIPTPTPAGWRPSTLRREPAGSHLSRGSGALGCPRDAVYEALHAASIPMHGPGSYPPPKEITPETAERVVSRYLAGSSSKRIAAELGLSADCIIRVVEARGLKRTRSEVASLAYAPRRSPAGDGCLSWSPSCASGMLPANPERRAHPEPRLRCAAVEAGGGPDATTGTAATRAGAKDAGDHAGRIGGGGAEAVCDRASSEGNRTLSCGSGVLGVPGNRVYRLLRAHGVLRPRTEANAVRQARRRVAEEEKRREIELRG